MSENLDISLVGRDKSFTATISKAVKALKGFQGQTDKTAKKASSGFARMGAAAAKGFGLIRAGAKRALSSLTSLQGMIVGGGIVVGLKKMVDSASDFETRLAEVSTLLDGDASAAMGRYKERLEEMVKTSSRSLGDLTKSLYQTISAGVTDEAQAFKVLDLAQKSAVAGLTDTSVAVDGITTLVNSFRLSMEDTDRAADLMFTTVKRGKTVFPDLASNIGKVTTLASQAGLSMEEMFASIATLTKGGLSTEMATTALRQFLANILKPSEDAKVAMKALGLEWGTAALEGGKFTETLQKMNAASGGNAEVLTRLVPNIRGLMGALVLGGDQIATYNEDLVAMGNAAGATEEAFAKMAKTSKEKLSIQWQRLALIAQRLGERLLPEVVDLLTDFADWAEKNGPEIYAAFVSLGEAIGDVLSVAKDLLRTLAAIATLGLSEYIGSRETGAHNRAMQQLRNERERQDAMDQYKRDLAEGGGASRAKSLLDKAGTNQAKRNLAMLDARRELERLGARAYEHKQGGDSAESSGAARHHYAVSDMLATEAAQLRKLIELYAAMGGEAEKSGRSASERTQDAIDKLKAEEDAAKDAADAEKKRFEDQVTFLDRAEFKELSAMEQVEARYNEMREVFKNNQEQMLRAKEWFVDAVTKLEDKLTAAQTAAAKKVAAAWAKFHKDEEAWVRGRISSGAWGSAISPEEQAASRAAEDRGRTAGHLGSTMTGAVGGPASNIAQGAAAGGAIGAIISAAASLALSDMPTEEEIAQARKDLEADFLERMGEARRKGDKEAIAALQEWYDSERKRIDKEAQGEFLNWFDGLNKKFINATRNIFKNLKGLLPMISEGVVEGIIGAVTDMDIAGLIYEGVYGAIKKFFGAIFDGFKDVGKGGKTWDGVLGFASLGISKFFHQGGVAGLDGSISRIQRAHSGTIAGLRRDEVPIIAQTGEGVMSREGMAAFDRMNRGGGGGSPVHLHVDGVVTTRNLAGWVDNELAGAIGSNQGSLSSRAVRHRAGNWLPGKKAWR